jgi:hypothetical protein
MAVTTAAHAATPITLPFGDFGLQSSADLHLPLPPPPQVARPDVTQMRLVIKRLPHGGCDQDDQRRPAQDRRQVVVTRAAPITTPRPSLLG